MGRHLNARSFALAVAALLVGFVLVPWFYPLFAHAATFFGVVGVAGWLAQVLRRRYFYETVSPDGKAVFITGCDSGFGHDLARRLDSSGFRVFAACLDPSGKGATTLQADSSPHLAVLPLDVTDAQSVTSAKEFVQERLGNDELWAVVNNAGIPQSGEVDWTPMEDIERVVDVNAFGTVRVTKAFLPLLRKARGRLVNVTSALGKFICPGSVGYCMSKSAGIAFCKGLRVEMMKWGVKVISIEPFFYKTHLTGPEFNLRLLEQSWSRADPAIKADYGEVYMQKLRQRTVSYLEWVCSRQAHQVVDSLEDAVVSEEPLRTYYPAYPLHKLGIQLLDLLPDVVREIVQKSLMDGRGKPAALFHKIHGCPANMSSTRAPETLDLS